MNPSFKHRVHATVACDARVSASVKRQKPLVSVGRTNDQAPMKSRRCIITAAATAIKTQSAKSFRSWHSVNEFEDYRMAFLRVFVGFSACRLNVEDE